MPLTAPCLRRYHTIQQRSPETGSQPCENVARTSSPLQEFRGPAHASGHEYPPDNRVHGQLFSDAPFSRTTFIIRVIDVTALFSQNFVKNFIFRLHISAFVIQGFLIRSRVLVSPARRTPG